MSHPRLSILIPAAGASKRLGQAKQLVQYKSGTLIQNAVNIAQSVEPLETIVVTGANAEAVKNTVQPSTVRWVHNPHWPAGMGSSIAAGIASINPGSSGVMILLSDQWRLGTSDLQAMVKTWQTNPERIVVARAGGQNMPPVIFPSIFFKQLGKLEGDRGGRTLIMEHPGLVTPVEIENAAYDLDTPEHLDEENFKGIPGRL